MNLKHIIIAITLIIVTYLRYANSVIKGRKMTDEKLEKSEASLLNPHTTVDVNSINKHIIYEQLNGTKNEGSLSQKIFVNDREVQEHENRDHTNGSSEKKQNDDVDEPVQKQNDEFELSQFTHNSTGKTDIESLSGHIFNIPLNGTENKCSLREKTFENAIEVDEHENIDHAEEEWEEEERNFEEQLCPMCNTFRSKKYEELAKHTEKCLSGGTINEKSNNEVTKKQIKHQNVVVDNEPVEMLSGNFDLSNSKYTIDDEETRIPAVINRIKSRLKHSNAAKMIIASYFCTMEVDFYSYNSNDQGWGCGYKNFQMLLSAMLRIKKYGDRVRWYFKKFGVEVMNVAPSILTIRKSIEYAWSLGFDPQGKRPLEGKNLSANDKWIGITEIKAVLATMRIRTEMIDSLTINKMGYHENMTNHIEEYFKSDKPDKLPIIFQKFGNVAALVPLLMSIHITLLIPQKLIVVSLIEALFTYSHNCKQCIAPTY